MVRTGMQIPPPGIATYTTETAMQDYVYSCGATLGILVFIVFALFVGRSRWDQKTVWRSIIDTQIQGGDQRSDSKFGAGDNPSFQGTEYHIRFPQLWGKGITSWSDWHSACVVLYAQECPQVLPYTQDTCFWFKAIPSIMSARILRPPHCTGPHPAGSSCSCSFAAPAPVAGKVEVTLRKLSGGAFLPSCASAIFHSMTP